MDEVRGSGYAEILEDGTLEIELDFDHGDDAILRAEREGSSAVCQGDRCWDNDCDTSAKKRF